LVEIKTTGLVLRRFRFSESSMVIVWLTRGQGKIKTGARGLLGPKSQLAGSVDLFHLVDLAAKKSARSELWQIREATLKRAFAPAQGGWSSLAAASYFATLVDHTTQPEEPCDPLFDLLDRGLNYLSTRAPDRRAILHFEKELCRSLGILGSAPPEAALQDYTGRHTLDRQTLLQNLDR